MAFVFANRVRFSTPTTGTGTFDVGAAESGFQTPSQAGVSDADTFRYLASEGANWEIGTGTYGASGPTVARSVEESSNSDSLVSFSGSAIVEIIAAAADLAGVSYVRKRQVFTSSGTYTPTTGMVDVNFRAVGAGAHGEGGGTSSSDPRRGGGSGTYGERLCTAAQVGASRAITIGAANSGTSTVVATLLTCPAAPANGSNTQAAAATSADFSVRGQLGENLHEDDANSFRASGAGSPLGAGGLGKEDEMDASGYGAGGSAGKNGSSGVRAAGNGTGGIVIADELVLEP